MYFYTALVLELPTATIYSVQANAGGVGGLVPKATAILQATTLLW